MTFLLLRGVEMDLKPRMMKLGVSRIHKYLPDFNETRFGPLDLQHANLEASLTPLTDVLLTFVVVFTVCHLLKKIVQVFLQGPRYFLRPTHYMEVILYTSSLAFAVGFFDVHDKFIPWRVQWLLGAVAAFFSWMNLIFHIQRYGKLGVYVKIFVQAMRVYIKAISVYFIMVVAFSITFCILNPEKILPDNPMFFEVDHKDDDPSDYQTAHVNLQSSLIRISDMLVGDVDAIANYINPLLSGMMVFPSATYFLAMVTVGVITLLIQAILMAIVVQNLREVERSASMNVLAMQVTFHTELEERLPRWFLKRINQTVVHVFPNRSKWYSFRWLKILTVDGLDGLNGLMDKSGLQKNDVGSLAAPLGFGDTPQKLSQPYSRLRILNAKMDHQRELLQSIVERMEINMDQDLIDDPATAQRRISRYAVVKQHKPRQLWKQLQNVQKLKSALRKSSVVERKISAIIEGGPAEEEDQVQADVFNT